MTAQSLFHRLQIIINCLEHLADENCTCCHDAVEERLSDNQLKYLDKSISRPSMHCVQEAGRTRQAILQRWTR